MTEKEAWKLCAILWENSTEHSNGTCHVLHGYGLCSTIDYLKGEGLISFDVSYRMKEKIKRIKRTHGSTGLFKFPLDRTGSNARAKFCMKQYRKV